MQGFPGIFCYISGVKVTDLVSLNLQGQLGLQPTVRAIFWFSVAG